MRIFDCYFIEEKNCLLMDSVRDTYIGEKIVVVIFVKNVLFTDLELKDVHLICEYESSLTQINLFDDEENK